MTLALTFGLIHAAWAPLVATDWAQAYIDFIFKLHFIRLDLRIEAFHLGTALLLISLTAGLGVWLDLQEA